MLIVNFNKLNHKDPKKKKQITFCHHFRHIWAAIEEGDNIVVVPFFAAKPAKRRMSPIFCGKTIEEGDDNCHLLLLCSKNLRKTKLDLTLCSNKKTKRRKQKLPSPSSSSSSSCCKKKKKKGTATAVSFYLPKKPKEEGDDNNVTIAFLFFLLQQHKNKKEVDGSYHPLLLSKKTQRRRRWQQCCCRNPNLAKCGGEAQHLEKLGIWSPPGLPNV